MIAKTNNVDIFLSGCSFLVHSYYMNNKKSKMNPSRMDMIKNCEQISNEFNREDLISTI